jgi:hypothetical protein
MKKDAARDLGDSCITETAGIGGFCMAAPGDRSVCRRAGQRRDQLFDAYV